jgi:voltage-gated potassium channel
VVGDQTVTTVGYGDVAPAHLTGRIVGSFVMLEGTAFIAIVTAVITSTFVARSTRDYAAAQARDETSDAERMEARFDELERKLDLLVAARGPGD